MRNDPRVHLYLGSPGTGKTTKMLDIVEREIAGGVLPGDIAFVTFTKAAANEAAERAGSKFGLTGEDLPWFRTIHSLSYARLGMSRDEVVDERDYRSFGRLVGEKMYGTYESDTPVPTGSKGDIMLRVVDFSSTCMITLQEAWHALNEPVDWHELKRFDATYRNYKADLGKIDFTDMLLTYTSEGDPLNVKVAVVDEAQDLTPAQWAVVRHAFSNCERVYICGDDDQAIYRWAGADVEYFLSLTDSPTVLPRSYRLPATVHALAQQVASRISHRYAKRYDHTGKGGSVQYHQVPDGVDIGEGEWLVLARNKYQLVKLEEMIREQGVNYSTRAGPSIDPEDIGVIHLWEQLRSGKRQDLSAEEVRTIHKSIGLPKPALRELDRYDPARFYERILVHPWYDALAGISRSRLDYYMACVRRGEKLMAKPRIRIETIHGVKGAEADHVMLMTDMSHRTAKGYAQSPDAEHRVFYVGVTRSKESLHIVAPQTDNSYPL